MTTAPTIIGIDLGKNWFHVIGVDERGATVLRKKLNRGQLAAYAATAPRGVVATEACPGSQYWGRVFAQAGHEVRILPAQFVKPYVKANKNDFHDAAAIAEAGSRASMRCVPLKTTEQLELQALHRMRQRVVRERTAVVNQMRALLLEHGIVVGLGRSLFERRLPAVFTDAESRLSPRLLVVLHRLRQRWLAIDVEIAAATRELTVWADQSDLCQRVVTIPGIGPLMATATVAQFPSIVARRVGGGQMTIPAGNMVTTLLDRTARHSSPQQLADFQENIDRFKELGTQVVALSGESPRVSRPPSGARVVSRVGGRHAFFEQTIFEHDLGHELLQARVFFPEIGDLRRGRFTARVADQSFLPGLEKLLAPAVIQIRR